MVSIIVRHEAVSDDAVLGKFYPTRGLEAAKRAALRDAHDTLLRAQQSNGFPTDPDEYTVFVTNRGRVRRVQAAGVSSRFRRGEPSPLNKADVRTLDERFLRIPFTIEWVSATGGVGKVKEAALFALALLRRRAPIRKGDYLASTSIWLNGRPVSAGYFQAHDLLITDRVFIAPDVPYGAVIELGFYKKRYQTQDIPGGIVRPIAKMVRDKFGDEVSATFEYLNPGAALGGAYGTLPAVSIAAPGVLIPNDSRPGRAARSKKGRR